MTTPQPTRRTYSPGHNGPEVDGETIAQNARAAAQAGHSLAFACPYPFDSQAGLHWVANYYLSKPRAAHPGAHPGKHPPLTAQAAHVLARSAVALELPQ